jgi:hypothetical protein
MAFVNRDGSTAPASVPAHKQRQQRWLVLGLMERISGGYC